MQNNKLQTFQLVCNKKPVSKWLITTREYGRFMMDYYDAVICNFELFKQESKDGEPDMVYHPGSKIGKYFDNVKIRKSIYMSTYFKKDSVVLDRLYKYGLAKPSDFNFINVDGVRGKLLRTYTPEQIELYVKTYIDRNFRISDVLLPPKQIKIRECDLKRIIMPKTEQTKKALFNVNVDKPVDMTLEEIEKELGHKVSIISQEVRNERNN